MKAQIRTSDLYFAAYLSTVGVPHKTEPSAPDSARMVFIFDAEDENEARQLQSEWFDGTGQVSAQEYASQVKILKSRVHAR